jgi:ATP phosphoribosyltransferase regulatory subunit
MRRWLLPEHIEDILPREARAMERLRRRILDEFAVHGYQLVIPPLAEYVESLLTGTGHDMDLATFRIVDQLSGRMMGVRADHTPQVARIDAHLLDRKGVARLCYCGSVLHTRPAGMTRTREPVQIGAELYGHAGLEADIEIARLMLAALAKTGVAGIKLDIGQPGIFRALLQAGRLESERAEALFEAVQQKNAAAINEATRGIEAAIAAGFASLPRLHGDRGVLAKARAILPAADGIGAALDDLEHLAQALAGEGVDIAFDLAELGGFNYENGIVFAAFTPSSPDAVGRGGRYDGIGRAFGRARAATGFTMDLRQLTALVPEEEAKGAILAPFAGDATLAAEIARLRAAGEVVVQALPGHEGTEDELGCDRSLVAGNGGWTIAKRK